MVFPHTVLGNKVEIYYDDAWHNIVKDTPLGTDEPNSRVRGLGAADGEIFITARGQADESSSLQPTQARFAINNKDGKYSPRNASSDLYGKIGKNTPCRIATDLCDTLSIVDTFSGTRTNTWGVTDESGHTWVNTTSGSTDNFDVAGGVGIHTHNANTTPCFSSVNSTVGGESLTITDFDIVVDGITPSAAASGDNIEVGIWGRRSGSSFVEARLLFNPGNQVLVAVREIINNVETGNTGFVVISGATSTDVMSFRFEAIGYTIRMRAWETANTEPSTWDRELEISHITPGALTLFSTLHAGNANSKPFTVTYNSFNASLGIVLFTGEVVEWPKRWDPTGSDVWVPVTATGITRRKRQGNRPTRSTLYNFVRKELGSSFLGLVGNVHHYWPLEKLSQQTRDVRCDMDGRTLLRFDVAEHNTVEWSSNDFLVGSDKLVTITGLPIPEGVVVVPFISAFDAPPLGKGYFDTPAIENPTSWVVMCWFYFPPLLEDFPFLPATSLYFSFSVPDSTIGEVFVDIQYRPDTNTIQGTLDSTSGDLTDGPVTMDYIDKPHLLMVRWTTDGSDETTLTAIVDDTILLLDTASFRPFAHCRRLTIEIEPYSPVTIGHLAMETGSDGTFLHAEVNTLPTIGEGRPGETAVERFERVLDTEGVAYEVYEGPLDADYPTILGPQKSDNFVGYLDDIRLADDGLVYELRTPAGYAFKTHNSLYDTDPKLELDYSAFHLSEVPEVQDDDQLTRNIVRIKRRGGVQGEVTSIVTDGPEGTDSAGDYEDGVIEVPVNTEESLADYAAWRTFKGTWDEDRWPALTVGLHRAPFVNDVELWVKALILDIGHMVSVANVPVWVGDNEDRMLQVRAVERIRLSNFEIDITWNMLPGGPYASLGVVDNASKTRADITECALEEAVDSDDDAFTVTTELTEFPYDTPLWTRNPGELHNLGSAGIDIRVNPASRAKARGGEKITVGAVADVRDTFTRSGAQLAGTDADTGETWAQTAGTATNMALNGSACVVTHSSANTEYWAELPLDTADWDHAVSVDVTLNFTTATGAQYSFDVILRQADTSNYYAVRGLLSASSSTLIMQLRRTVGGSTSQIGNNYTIGTNASGTAIHVKAAVWAKNLYAKMWIGSATEPPWQHLGIYSVPEAVNGESIGLRSTRATGNTNTNPTTTFDNLQVWKRHIQPVVWDRFARTDPNNPLTFPDAPHAQISYSWFAVSAVEADFDVAPNTLTMTITSANNYLAMYLNEFHFQDVVVSTLWSCPVPTGADLEPGGIMLRGTGITSYVLCRANINTSNQITLEVNDSAGNSLGTRVLGHITHAASTPTWLKAGAFGDQVGVKLWRPTDPEPPYWQLTVTDPNPATGWTGMRAGRANGNTNANAAMVFHQYEVENPQRITATRSVNGVVRSHEAGSDFRLWSPFRVGR